MFQVIAICILPLLMRVHEKSVSAVGTVKQLHDTDALTLLPPDDIQFGFEKKIGPIVLHGQAKLHDGTGAGLDMIHRVGDASVDIFNDSSVKVKCCLGMDVIERN
ncbi:uncharacterized protein LOC111263667 isoform X2 [Varroa jacobsoni]|uniref:uncharacterized protein LOC111263667 isoform X2 n=1 Tax=Varroa jacobsoni TaxID=62625 RepID=UPI000BF8F3C3|nr:uncharacterized protein LOC111263667 isoform X2 [Varroa jacobsoni]